MGDESNVDVDLDVVVVDFFVQREQQMFADLRQQKRR